VVLDGLAAITAIGAFILTILWLRVAILVIFVPYAGRAFVSINTAALVAARVRQNQSGTRSSKPSEDCCRTCRLAKYRHGVPRNRRLSILLSGVLFRRPRRDRQPDLSTRTSVQQAGDEPSRATASHGGTSSLTCRAIASMCSESQPAESRTRSPHRRSRHGNGDLSLLQ
jgi:hypothetical protein